MLRILAMIPARLGSKRIPKKNLRFLGGKPLLMYPLELAKASGNFEEIWLNTESSELKSAAEKAGVLVHIRPEHLAGDNATNRDFTYEFLEGHPCDYLVMLNTTSPLLRLDTLNAFLEVVKSSKYDTVLSVVSEKAETFFKGAPLNFSLKEKINSQLIEPVDKIVWALTAWRRDSFLKLQKNGENPVFGGVLHTFSIPKDEACDLDTEEDWRIAQGVLQARSITETPQYLYSNM